jgi:hypothetical protein
VSDELPIGRIVGVGAAALALFIASCVWVYGEIRVRQHDLGGRAPTPLLVGREEIGIVNQRPFALTQNAADLRREQRRRLETYGWVDPAHQLIHLPIERAMQLMVERGTAP